MSRPHLPSESCQLLSSHPEQSSPLVGLLCLHSLSWASWQPFISVTPQDGNNSDLLTIPTFRLCVACDGQTPALATKTPNDPSNIMGMSSSGVAGQFADSSGDRIKRSASTRIPKFWRQNSMSIQITGREDGLNKRVPATRIGREGTVLRRKKLPWLDGPQQSKPGQVPGNFDPEEGVGAGDAHDSSPPPVPEKDIPAPPDKRASTSSFGRDLALRAVGSTPSLRKRARSGDFKTLSLASQRPGVKPAISKHDAKQKLGVVSEGSKGAGYASSEYSATPSSDRSELPAALPNRDPSSYERLVDRRTSKQLESPQTFQVANQWLQSQLDLPLDLPVSPRQSVKPVGDAISPQISPGQRVKSVASSDSCMSCDRGPRLHDMPKAKTLPRHSIAIQQAELPPPPPLAPAPRKPTLFAMPDHLLPSSSSSSHDAIVRPPMPSISSPQSPAPPPKAFTTQDMRRQSQSLHRAVTGLENLMEEAVNVARNAAENGRNDDVAHVLDSAMYALRKASTVHGQMNTDQMSQPLVLSPAVSDRDSDSDSIALDSDASSIKSTTGHSVETAPTLLTKSAQSSQQPILVDQYNNQGKLPVSRHASVEDASGRNRGISPDRHSMSRTPPRLYQPPSADSIVRDFAYVRAKTARAEAARQLSRSYGAASDYYEDNGQSVGTQLGVRPSLRAPMITNKSLPNLPGTAHRPAKVGTNNIVPPHGPRQKHPVRQMEPVPTKTVPVPPRQSSRSYEKLPDAGAPPRRRTHPKHHRPHLSDLFESAYYRQHPKQDDGYGRGDPDAGNLERGSSIAIDARYADPNIEKGDSVSKSAARYSGPPALLQRNVSLRHPRRNHISLKEGQGFSLGRFHKRQPIAREWSTSRKRLTATIACLNTAFIGLITGIYVTSHLKPLREVLS